MKIEIWSDIVCPFCYIGKHNFSSFMNELPEGEKIEVVNRSYELDPHADITGGEKTVSALAKKYGISVEEAKSRMESVEQMAENSGLKMNIFETRSANTYDLHRMVQYAGTLGKEEEMLDILFRAYFVEGLSLNDRKIIMELGREAGLEKAKIERLLSSDDFSENVDEDISKAKKLGIRGVPYFLFDGKYEVSGAQPKEVFRRVYESIREKEEENRL